MWYLSIGWQIAFYGIFLFQIILLFSRTFRESWIELWDGTLYNEMLEDAFSGEMFEADEDDDLASAALMTLKLVFTLIMQTLVTLLVWVILLLLYPAVLIGLIFYIFIRRKRR